MCSHHSNIRTMEEEEVGTNETPQIKSNNRSWERTHFKKGPIEWKTSGDNLKTCWKGRPLKQTFQRPVVEKKPSTSVGSSAIHPSGVLDIIDNLYRGGSAETKGVYSGAGTYVHAGEHKPGMIIPRAGAWSEAGVGKAKAVYSVFEAEANGPNARAGAEANVAGVGAMATAEVGSVSASAGPIKVTLGLGVDTGFTVGVDGLQVKVLGTGFTLGPRPSVSIFGSKIECVVM